jgi:nucleotide-binding universal stress UspA family protein
MTTASNESKHDAMLAVLDAPGPPVTSPLPAARRAYAAARARWTEIERERLHRATDALLPGIAADADVVFAPALHGDLARTIVKHADAGRADVVIVGGPPPGFRAWIRPGPVHERVVRFAGCTVVVA